MDHFLKGESNRFDALPPVRIEVRSSRDGVSDVRWEKTWPLENTVYSPLYLWTNNALSATTAMEQAEAVYDGTKGAVEFDYVFPEATEVTGYIKLKLWVEARARPGETPPPDDMILCCFIDKQDIQGQSIRFYGSVGQNQDMLTRGYGRATRRELNLTETKPYHPVLLGARDEKLRAGDVVPLEIAFCPSSTFFGKGERLRLIVSATDIVHAPIFKKDTSINRGRHIVHFGGAFDSHLLIPRILKS